MIAMRTPESQPDDHQQEEPSFQHSSTEEKNLEQQKAPEKHPEPSLIKPPQESAHPDREAQPGKPAQNQTTEPVVGKSHHTSPATEVKEKTEAKTGLKPDPEIKTAALPQAEPAAEHDIIKEYMMLMSVKQKIGQRFITKIEGTELHHRNLRLISRQYAGGVILYPWNIESAEQINTLTRNIQQAAMQNFPPVKLFIGVDREGGRVSSFRFNQLCRFPAPYYWAQYNDPKYIAKASYVINRELVALGCNMNFAPVLDLYGRPDGTIIGDRSMGNDPEKIAGFGLSYLRGAREAGVIPVIKHFPGHGGSTVDSHSALPAVDMGLGELEQRDLKPFIQAIQHGAPAVMTGHILFPRIDPLYPATISEHILGDLLRNKYGFQGVIITDGLSMGALSNHFSTEETLDRLFHVGVDLILVHHRYSLEDLTDQVYELYLEGKISMEEIDQGVERILRLKQEYGLIPGN
ncbi:MAG: beta-N-acetylhexosaminidase, partial [Spirochaetota bacterium]